MTELGMAENKKGTNSHSDVHCYFDRNNTFNIFQYVSIMFSIQIFVHHLADLARSAHLSWMMSHQSGSWVRKSKVRSASAFSASPSVFCLGSAWFTSRAEFDLQTPPENVGKKIRVLIGPLRMHPLRPCCLKFLNSCLWGLGLFWYLNWYINWYSIIVIM